MTPDLTPDLTVDLSAAEPPFEQVRAQIAGHIATGALTAGDRLPTIRALAADLGLAGNTIGRAYRELEAAGLVETRRRTGTVVLASASASPVALHRTATDLALMARRNGLDETGVLDLVRAAFRQTAEP